MRISAAAELLGVSVSTIHNMVNRKVLDEMPRPDRVNTSPKRLYEAQVLKLAKEWGIL